MLLQDNNEYYITKEKIKMFCSKCGKQIADNSSFCTSCGSKVNVPNSTAGGTYTTYTNTGSTASNAINGNTTNVFAILGLIFAFVMPILGIIFSCVGLSEAKQKNGSGHGMAKAGLILSIIFIALVVIYAIFFAVFLASQVDSWWVEHSHAILRF